MTQKQTMMVHTLPILILLLLLQGCQTPQFTAHIPNPPCVQAHKQIREYGIDLLCWYDKHVGMVLPPKASFDPFIITTMHDAMKRRAFNTQTERHIHQNVPTPEIQNVPTPKIQNVPTPKIDADATARLVFGAELVLKTVAECPGEELANQERELMTIQKMQTYDHNLSSMAGVNALVTKATNGTFSEIINTDILRDYASMTTRNMHQGACKHAAEQIQYANDMLTWIGRRLIRGPNEKIDVLHKGLTPPPNRSAILNAIKKISQEISTSRTYLNLQRAYPCP